MPSYYGDTGVVVINANSNCPSYSIESGIWGDENPKSIDLGQRTDTYALVLDLDSVVDQRIVYSCENSVSDAGEIVLTRENVLENKINSFMITENSIVPVRH